MHLLVTVLIPKMLMSSEIAIKALLAMENSRGVDKASSILRDFAIYIVARDLDNLAHKNQKQLTDVFCICKDVCSPILQRACQYLQTGVSHSSLMLNYKHESTVEFAVKMRANSPADLLNKLQRYYTKCMAFDVKDTANCQVLLQVS